jgi:hypothetical protein
MNGLQKWLFSSANWCGLGLATVALLLSAVGLTQWGGVWGTVALAGLGYGVGFGVGGMWLGFPKAPAQPWDELEFADEGDARTAMTQALTGVRQLVQHNPEGRLPASLQTKVVALCDQLTALLNQWERSKGHLSLEESFHARHIALSYLPDALKAYLSIPKAFAATQTLDSGKTAEELFRLTLDDLNQKVQELKNDLAQQDAQAFVNHSQFLREKFRRSGQEASELPRL